MCKNTEVKIPSRRISKNNKRSQKDKVKMK